MRITSPLRMTYDWLDGRQIQHKHMLSYKHRRQRRNWLLFSFDGISLNQLWVFPSEAFYSDEKLFSFQCILKWLFGENRQLWKQFWKMMKIVFFLARLTHFRWLIVYKGYRECKRLALISPSSWFFPLELFRLKCGRKSFSFQWNKSNVLIKQRKSCNWKSYLKCNVQMQMHNEMHTKF